jgi:Flp pilus assembly protein TadB
VTALLLAALGLLAVPVGGRSDRLARAGLGAPPVARSGGGLLRRHSRLVGAVAAGLGVAAVVGGPVGAVLGVGAGVVAAQVFRRLEPAAARRLRERRLAELPDVLDLLVTALSAGLPVPAALATVAAATEGPLAADLIRVGELSALGAGPAAAWADHVADPALGPVARAAQRSADSGSALAGSLARVAGDLRADAAARAETAAHRAGVLAMAPLGLCFLPAFICLGVVPVVIGVATQVLP